MAHRLRTRTAGKPHYAEVTRWVPGDSDLSVSAAERSRAFKGGNQSEGPSFINGKTDSRQVTELNVNNSYEF